MLKTALTAAAIFWTCTGFYFAGTRQEHHLKVARHGSEWVETITVPPCSYTAQNIEVIYPPTFNGTVTIECSDLK